MKVLVSELKKETRNPDERGIMELLVRRIAKQMLQALQYAHECGVIHTGMLYIINIHGHCW